MSWPVVTAHYITRLGWRDAFVAMALTYIVVTVPTTYFLFLDSQEPRRRAAAPVPRMQALRSRAFLYVMLAGGLFGSVTLGLGFHMVPLMRANGFDLTTAAGIAGAAGFATLVGRIGTGLLLDRLPVRQVGIAVFLLPALVSLLLLQGRVSLPIAFIAAILFGLASGAETDIVTYMISRHFAPIFATAYAIANQFFAVCASLGPLLAGALFDFSGSYNLYLTLILPTVTVAAILIWRVPPMGDKLFRSRADH
jgi:predicted MFS family arabinose efflux permease